MDLTWTKGVLQYLPPEMRLLLSQKCPQLLPIDRSTPLRIHTFHIHPLQLQFNKTTFKLGIIRHFHHATERNLDSEGVQHDVDLFGLEKQSPEFDLTSGEYLIVNVAPKNTEMKSRIDSLNVAQMSKRIREIQGVPGKEAELMELKNKILPFELKEEGEYSLIPYTHYLKLTVTTVTTDGTSSKYTERVDYCRSIQDGMKYLTWKLLEGRGLQVGTLKMHSEGFYRIPETLSIHTNHLDVHLKHTDSLNSIFPLLADSSFPLHSVTVYQEAELHNPIVQSSQMIVVAPRAETLQLDRLNHHRVHIRWRSIQEDKVTRLVKKWVELKKGAGTMYTFVVHDDVDIASVMEEIAAMRGAKTDSGE
ncbi:hypothetical protein CRE_26742 [Caenorhabditis remanei]|uniref:F-box C protein n=1 Tax=Caenorhabditis remanei TaxID=31234 RepID=E3MXT3_CAERE|nr:hypothetical protein CRE_26742 [Caenorhabditis remanei]